MGIDVSQLRRNYTKDGLRRKDLRADPFEQFELWFGQSMEAQLLEPNAMTLATSTAEGFPTQRTVLLKGFDASGFVFYTNYESQKGKEIEQHPNVSLLFPWIELERQIIVNGVATKVSRSETDKYFSTRPPDSQIGAWASAQSEVIASKEVLEASFAEVREKFATGKISAPPFWGGYRVEPTSVEFWQGGAGRLHDRFRYTREDASADWKIERHAP